MRERKLAGERARERNLAGGRVREGEKFGRWQTGGEIWWVEYRGKEKFIR